MNAGAGGGGEGEGGGGGGAGAALSELYFLIARFLQGGPLRRTASVLLEELQEAQVLPARRDWLGQEHARGLPELEEQYPHVTANHLLEVCVNLLRRGEREPRVSLLSAKLAGRDVRPPRPPYNVVSRVVTRGEGRTPLGAPPGPRLLPPKLFASLQLQRRTLGHLSAVYCVLFDRTGNYIITGADDLLVKVWSATDGRLLMTCRGAASEITDVCVSHDNRLLCAGSLDRLIRVWDLESGAPVAVLQGHSGMITSVHFCPARAGDLRCLVSTSTDGSVAFWTYSQSGRDGQVNFISKPVQYMERMRPGACHMICCCWSPGGAFLAAGSADHHVRVYMMAEQGPNRILEVAAHSDAVDSLAWCNRGLKFVSGSKDGTAILWQLHATQWRHTTLHMTACLPGQTPPSPEDGKRVKVTMVCWDCQDAYIITAASDHTIKVWCARTCRLVRVLRGHNDETYVLEAHPFLSSVLLSAGHDGQMIIWDMESGVALNKFLNHIEGQGHGAVFDAKWAPDGTRCAGTDSHGHLLMWGLGQGHPNLRKLPTELFFHTDYRPLTRDALGGALDEQTEVPPHLMPPPFLVDVEGAPHAPHLQRLVPGRENLTLSQLIPLTGGEVGVGGGGQPRSQIDLIIEELARQWQQDQDHPDHNPNDPDMGDGGGRRGNVWRGEGVRHTAGVWQRGEPIDNYTRRPIVAPLPSAHYEQLDQASEEMSNLEMGWYKREMRRRPLMISTAEMGVPSGPRRRPGRVGRRAPVQRPPAPRPRVQTPRQRDSTPMDMSTHQYDDDEESEERLTADDSSDTSDSSVRLSVHDRTHSTGTSDEKTRNSSSSASSDYSDWVADEPSHSLAPPKRSKRKPIARKRYSPASAKRVAMNGDTSTPAASTSADGLTPADDGSTLPDDRLPLDEAPLPVELPEDYRPSEWLCAVTPRKAPYHPQMGDECLYFKLGHQRYLEAVSEKDVYKINPRDKPWERTSINECELVKVVGIKYLIRPPRIVCLKLAVLDGSQRSFTVKYHDMADVIDFLVLRQQYETCVERRWAAGDRFRCMIDDMWWTGAVVEALGAPGRGEGGPAQHFLSLRVRWDNGEYERMSPWDLEPIDHHRLPAEVGGCTAVLASELEAVLYRPRPDEWPPDGDRARACRHVVRALDQVMGLSMAEPFVAPVDLNVYPSYAYIVEYPIDLSTIKARFENHFYRRVAAAQFDVRYLATNAEKFNQPHSHIVRQARIVTDLLLRIISEWRDVEVVSAYHAIVEAYHSSDSDTNTNSNKPSTSGGRMQTKSRRAGVTRRAGLSRRAGTSWNAESQQLLRELMSSRDAEPFLRPVSDQQAPDYHAVVSNPMDLGTVRARLLAGDYATPDHLARDVRLVFANSRLYNTNERSRIYSMTLRLSTLFEELFRNASSRWPGRRHRPPVEEYATSDEETLAATSRRKRTRRGADPAGASPAEAGVSGLGRPNGHVRESDSWDSDVPLTRNKGKGVGKKSKPAGATTRTWVRDEASTSQDVQYSCERTQPRFEAASEAAALSHGDSTEYEQVEVLDLGAEGADDRLSPSDGLASSDTGDSYQPPGRSAGRQRARRPRKRLISRSDDTSGSEHRRQARRRRTKKPPKRRKKCSRGVSEHSMSSSASAATQEGPGEPAATRYESDRSYRPRVSSDDSAPLHTYRYSNLRTPVEPHAGPSRAHRSAHPHLVQGGRSRRSLPALRYNEDSEEDSIAAISKRLRDHTARRQSRMRPTAAPHTVDHNYHNGHGSRTERSTPRPSRDRPSASVPHTPRTPPPPTTHHQHNCNTSDGGDDEPLSISSRGRVRKLTAKARGLLRD